MGIFNKFKGYWSNTSAGTDTVLTNTSGGTIISNGIGSITTTGTLQFQPIQYQPSPAPTCSYCNNSPCLSFTDGYYFNPPNNTINICIGCLRLTFDKALVPKKIHDEEFKDRFQEEFK